MACFILVPGAWHGAWCWERVVPLLEAAGHRALAPELIGMGADRARASEGSLARWADQLAAIVTAEPGPVILAGHSRGGAVISEVAERVPERIDRLVYIAALLLPGGKAVRDLLHGVEGAERTAIVRHDDGTCTVDPGDARAAAYNTTPPDWAARAIARLGPEPRIALTTPVQVTAERFGQVPRAYIACRHDRTVPLATQLAMQADWPCDPAVVLECDHAPFYSAPDALAAALLGLVR
jgi:pimeloyl-ACP methyl ester carboxylesterase